MKVIFRTKASSKIGFGHLRRCITLAKALRAKSADIAFVLNDDESASQVLQDQGFDVFNVTEKDDDHLQDTCEVVSNYQADVLVLDSYDLNTFAAKTHRDVLKFIIEDRMDINLTGEVLLNPMLDSSTASHFNSMFDDILYGYHYLLLDEAFTSQSNRAKSSNSVENLLVTLGGGDQKHQSVALVEWVRQVWPVGQINLVVGPFFDDKLVSKLTSLAEKDVGLKLIKNQRNLRDLMSENDLAISGGGQTLFELAATGLPTLAVQVAENQMHNLKSLVDANVILNAGDLNQPDAHNVFKQHLEKLMTSITLRTELRQNGMKLVDGQGAARVANYILNRVGGNDAKRL